MESDLSVRSCFGISVFQNTIYVLTNGITYLFFIDLDEKNKMDEKQFFEFNSTSLKDNSICEIAKFHTSNFDVEKVIDEFKELVQISTIT